MRKKIFAPGLVRPVVFPHGVPAELGVGEAFTPIRVWAWSTDSGERDFGADWVYDFEVQGGVFSYYGGDATGADLWQAYLDRCPGGANYVVGQVD